MRVTEDDVRRGLQPAVRWLSESGIRSPEGAYTSIYSPKTGRYLSWDGTQTCLNATVGAVLALGDIDHLDLALRSAQHVCDLALDRGHRMTGALLSGAQGSSVFSNWTFSAIVALLRAFEWSGSERFLETARAAGYFVLAEMTATNGSVIQKRSTDRVADFTSRLLMPRQVWGAGGVRAFQLLHDLGGDERFGEAAQALARWVSAQQSPSGWFPTYVHTPVSRLAWGVRRRSATEILDGCRIGHPTAQTRAIEALMLSGDREGARRTAKWLAERLSPNGLLYEQYSEDGTHGLVEDVMPTAHFGLLLLDHPQLTENDNLVGRIAGGILYAQIESADSGAHGAMRGLPLDPKLGGDAYAWDTAFAIRFLFRYLNRLGSTGGFS